MSINTRFMLLRGYYQPAPEPTLLELTPIETVLLELDKQHGRLFRMCGNHKFLNN